MTFWHVVTKFFDSGKVKVNLAPIEADHKPENHMSENKTCDEYRDCGKDRDRGHVRENSQVQHSQSS